MQNTTPHCAAREASGAPLGAEPELSALQAYMCGQAPPPEAETLRRLMHRYSYFAAPVAAMLRAYGAELIEDERAALRGRLSLLSGSSTAAGRLVDSRTDAFYPPTTAPEPRANRTDAALDTFFATYGHTSPEEEALLERLIFNPVPDYSQVLAREESPEGTPAPPADLTALSGALRPSPHCAAREASGAPQRSTNQVTTPTPRPAPARKPQPKASDETPLSLSLAKIFIRQGRYERAYEIINGLNLNYPEKNAYFADQLRFLRRLIDLQRQSKASAGGVESAD